MVLSKYAYNRWLLVASNYDVYMKMDGECVDREMKWLAEVGKTDNAQTTESSGEVSAATASWTK